MKTDKRAYCKIIDILGKSPMTRRSLINAYMESLGLSREELLDKSTGGKANVARSKVGTILDDMQKRGMIIKSSEGIYSAIDQKPVIIRKEKCEAEILKMLSRGPMSKSAIRKELEKIFGTARTVSDRDDSKLYSYMGEALRVMVREGALLHDGKVYSLAGRIAARIDDINSLMTLKAAYLSKLHSRGGEFFEVYFMNLLGKYVTLCGKTVTYNSTTGGSADGGIDGILKTEDSLGFRETIMVQTKNRIEPTNETTARGFYGAVCAKQGTRGIFATSSDFHQQAKDFFDSLDDCVGIDGDKLFEMAVKTHYGIKKVGSELALDDKII